MSDHDTQLETLFAAVCDGRASVAEQRELTERLQSDAAVRDQYLAYVDLHAQLATEPAVGELTSETFAQSAGQGSCHPKTKERELIMSKNVHQTGDTHWTPYATAVCVLVLVGSSFAMYSMSGLDHSEEVAGRTYDVDSDVIEGEGKGDGKFGPGQEGQKREWHWKVQSGEGKSSGQKTQDVAGTVALVDNFRSTGLGLEGAIHRGMVTGDDTYYGKNGRGNRGQAGNYTTEVDAIVTERLAKLNTGIRDESTVLHRRLSLDLVELDKEGRESGAVGGGAAGYFELIEGEERRRGESTRDRYSRIIENAFKGVVDHPLSTFSIDVDTASYANTRQYLMQSHRLPPADAVRIEELVNYFDYAYDGPSGDDPFASHIEVAACPWQPKHRLVRVALKGKEIDRKERPKSNLVFLVDVSGSMNSAKKLPLVKQGLKLLTKELGKDDRVAMVVYAGAAGLVLDSTVGYEKETINAAIDKLNAGGSTAGGAGIKLAYQTAVDNFIRGGVNRVILCSDGDFNVGVSNTAELEKMAEDHAKSGVFLSVMGFGRGNLNDAMMERITNKGNGNYAYLDTEKEAKKVFVEQMSGTLVTIAKDVKIQIEFNPAAVAGYRLIGYENRMLAKEDFNDDTKDAGEIGAGHAVTALYEIVPAGGDIPTPDVDELKYQKPTSLTKEAKSGEMLTLKVRYKQPDGEKSKLLEFPVKDSGKKADAASGDFKFASAVASFGMLLRGSKYAGDATYDSVLKLADAGKGDDTHGYRAEFIDMVKQAKKVDKRP